MSERDGVSISVALSGEGDRQLARIGNVHGIVAAGYEATKPLYTVRAKGGDFRAWNVG